MDAAKETALAAGAFYKQTVILFLPKLHDVSINRTTIPTTKETSHVYSNCRLNLRFICFDALVVFVFNSIIWKIL